MEKEQPDELVYGDLRVLELAGEMGVYCGRLLADLGAEVIKIEQPGGDPTRRIGPFVGDDPHPEKSLYWFQFNTSKKSITLDITTADGKELFKKLAATVDIVIETFAPGYMDSLGLGFEALRQGHPELIMTSITPFGQTGPYRNYKGSDIVGIAMGGLMNLAGFPEGSPVRLGGSQAHYQASLHAAVATLIALDFRDISGQGQRVDGSMQQSVTLSTETAMQFWDLDRHVATRVGAEHRRPGFGTYPCKDGYICLLATVATVQGRWPRFVEWMNEEGYGLELAGIKDVDRHYLSLHCDEIDAIIMPWLLDHTMEDLYIGAQSRDIIVMPVNTPKSLVESVHLNARGFFIDVDHPELGATCKYPGPPYRAERIKWRIAHRAPLIGEHNEEIYGYLGLSKQDMVALKGAGAI